MPVKRHKPTSPGRRHAITSTYSEITKGKPEKSLTASLKKSGGRNSYGRITVRHRGGGFVDGLSDEFKYALVAGAVTGGGLTVIANAPNPAGFAILRDYFRDRTINPFGLLAAALGPTAVTVLAFRWL